MGGQRNGCKPNGLDWAELGLEEAWDLSGADSQGEKQMPVDSIAAFAITLAIREHPEAVLADMLNLMRRQAALEEENQELRRRLLCCWWPR
ncbi:MAG: hypothetical protein M0P73_12930 [Syntrophobacterales bacterium]|jgi:hypothetical protein|nr:hypothetical protein [Syntrophobacterales bacterium]